MPQLRSHKDAHRTNFVIDQQPEIKIASTPKTLASPTPIKAQHAPIQTRKNKNTFTEKRETTHFLIKF